MQSLSSQRFTADGGTFESSVNVTFQIKLHLILTWKMAEKCETTLIKLFSKSEI